MTKSAREELLSIQKKIYNLNKRIIEDSILFKEPGFESYEGAYKRCLSKYSSLSSQDQLLKSVLDADIIYIGDYHTCNQSQRSFLRILKGVVKRTENFAVGLELINVKHQHILDKFMAFKITEESFLSKIKLKEHWVYDLWENFKPIFDFCRYHNIKIHAIDSESEGANVSNRDRASARIIARIFKGDRSRKILVLIGDLHIAPKHLPNEVKKILDHDGNEGFKDLILYQNSESIYWKLAKKGLDNSAEVVKIDKRSYCRMHTPPIICQRSYLNWLEHDEAEIDYSHARCEFVELVHRICEFMRIEIDEKELDGLEIFTCGDLSFLAKLRKMGLTKKDVDQVKNQILASESYYIAKANIVYLANLSINHASEEAAHFIKTACTGIERPRLINDAFYANILHEALGFFGSKIINSRRKCLHEREFSELMKYLDEIGRPKGRILEYETAEIVSQMKRYERRNRYPGDFSFIFGRIDLFISVTHALGYMLGERIFYGLLSNKIARSRIRELFFDSWNKAEEPFMVYRELISKLKKVNIPARM